MEDLLPTTRPSIGEVQDAKERIDQYFRTLTKEARDQALLGGVELQTAVLQGHEVETIVNLHPRRADFDLLLAGHHGHSHIFDRLIGRRRRASCGSRPARSCSPSEMTARR